MNKKTQSRQTNRGILLLVILAIISLVALMASFAKYTGKAGEASDTAKIAKWSVTLNAQDNTILKHNYTTNLATSTDTLLAPGVSGSYQITLTNSGDVAAKISSIELSKTGVELPLEFSIDGTTWLSLSQVNTKLADEASKMTTLTAGQKDVAFATLSWRWPFESTDTSTTDPVDTAIGTNSTVTEGRSDYGLKLTVIATQVKPTPAE